MKINASSCVKIQQCWSYWKWKIKMGKKIKGTNPIKQDTGPNQHLSSSAITTAVPKCHLWSPFPLCCFKSTFHQFSLGPGECFPLYKSRSSGFGTEGWSDAISGRELEDPSAGPGQLPCQGCWAEWVSKQPRISINLQISQWIYRHLTTTTWPSRPKRLQAIMIITKINLVCAHALRLLNSEHTDTDTGVHSWFLLTALTFCLWDGVLLLDNVITYFIDVNNLVFGGQ